MRSVLNGFRGPELREVFTERLLGAGVDRTVGATGASYDDILAETIDALFNTEPIRSRGPRRTLEQIEIAALERIDWCNDRRIAKRCGDLTPVEFEQADSRETGRAHRPALTRVSLRTRRGDSSWCDQCLRH